jgi:hypothetical protein
MVMRSIFQRRMAVLFILVLWGSILPNHIWAEDACGKLADKIGHGGVLWTENAIMVQGTSAPNLNDPYKAVSAIKRESQRAATLDALRKAAGILAGVSVEGDRISADNPQVIAQIRAYVQQPEICKAKYYEDGGVDIVVMVPLIGRLTNALLPSAGSSVAASQSDYTGLVIDASELPFIPAIAPRLIGPDGEVLFSHENVKKEIVARAGVVKYVNSPKDIGGDFVGSRPMRVKAAGLGSLSPSDLVIGQSALEILSQAPFFLGEGKVAIIIAPVRRIQCSNMTDQVQVSKVDWEKRIAYARGFGRASFTGKEDNAVRLRMLERAAEVDAQRKLLDVILNIRIDGDRALKDDSDASRQIEGIIRNAVFCGAKYYRDGTATAVVAAPIDGLIAKGSAMGRGGVAAKAIPDSHHTGLIIDASGLNFKPVLAPSLVARDNTEIYGPGIVSKGYARQFGVAGYRSSMDEALKDERVGKSPVIVRAEEVSDNLAQLRLALKDIDKLGQLKNMIGQLTQARVIIVINKIAEK